jgi:hypothetical protein
MAKACLRREDWCFMGGGGDIYFRGEGGCWGQVYPIQKIFNTVYLYILCIYSIQKHISFNLIQTGKSMHKEINFKGQSSKILIPFFDIY